MADNVIERQPVTLQDLRTRPWFHVWRREGGDFAAAAGIGRDAAYGIVARGEVASVRIGRKVVVPTWAILQYLGYGQDAA